MLLPHSKFEKICKHFCTGIIGGICLAVIIASLLFCISGTESGALELLKQYGYAILGGLASGALIGYYLYTHEK